MSRNAMECATIAPRIGRIGAQTNSGPGSATNTVIPGPDHYEGVAMSKRTCSIDGCERPFRARGWCASHYNRWALTGDPVTPSRRPDAKDRFHSQVRPQGGCLVWVGGTDGKGYGRFNVNGRPKRAHRYAWEQANGPIPEGMFIDHICHNRACVEVTHLRLATDSQNNSYLAGAKKNSSLGIRNVYPHRGKYRVQVQKGRVNYGGIHSDLGEAIAESESLRLELFGAYSGPTPYLDRLVEDGHEPKEGQ